MAFGFPQNNSDHRITHINKMINKFFTTCMHTIRNTNRSIFADKYTIVINENDSRMFVFDKFIFHISDSNIFGVFGFPAFKYTIEASTIYTQTQVTWILNWHGSMKFIGV